MAAVGIAGLFLVIARGPVELAFLSDRIAVGLEQRLNSGLDVEVGRTVLEKSDSGFSLHVLDIVMKDNKGREILRSPDALVSFSPLQLIRFNFAPDKLALKGMKLRAEITAEGEVLFTSTGASASATRRLDEVIAAILGVGAPASTGASTGGWSALSIAEASLVIDDRRNGKQLSFENMNLTFGSPREGVLEATGSLSKERDLVRFSLLSETVGDDRRLRIGFRDVGDPILQARSARRCPISSSQRS